VADPGAAPEPIAILAPGPGWAYVCATSLVLNPERTTAQSVCECGWRTEAVLARRAWELMDLESRHMADSVAGMCAYLETVRRNQATPTEQEASLMRLLDVIDGANGRGDA